MCMFTLHVVFQFVTSLESFAAIQTLNLMLFIRVKALDVNFQRIWPFALSFTNETVKGESVMPSGVLLCPVPPFENPLTLITRKNTFLFNMAFLFFIMLHGLSFTVHHFVSVALIHMLSQKVLPSKSFTAKLTVISNSIMYEP